MSALLPARELGGCGGEGQTELHLKGKGRRKFFHLPGGAGQWSWGPVSDPFSFLTRLPALCNSPHSEHWDDDPAFHFGGAALSLLAQAQFFFWVSLSPKGRLGSRGFRGR